MRVKIFFEEWRGRGVGLEDVLCVEKLTLLHMIHRKSVPNFQDVFRRSLNE